MKQETHKDGEDMILPLGPAGWDSYLASPAIASDDFMEQVEVLPVQERFTPST